MDAEKKGGDDCVNLGLMELHRLPSREYPSVDRGQQIFYGPVRFVHRKVYVIRERVPKHNIFCWSAVGK